MLAETFGRSKHHVALSRKSTPVGFAAFLVSGSHWLCSEPEGMCHLAGAKIVNQHYKVLTVSQNFIILFVINLYWSWFQELPLPFCFEHGSCQKLLGSSKKLLQKVAGSAKVVLHHQEDKVRGFQNPDRQRLFLNKLVIECWMLISLMIKWFWWIRLQDYKFSSSALNHQNPKKASCSLLLPARWRGRTDGKEWGDLGVPSWSFELCIWRPDFWKNFVGPLIRC